MKINTNIDTIPNAISSKLDIFELQNVYFNHFMNTIPCAKEIMIKSKNGKKCIRKLSDDALNNLVYIIKEGVIADPEHDITMLDMMRSAIWYIY